MDIKVNDKNEFVEHLKNRLKEELTDVDTYNSLYESFKAHGFCDEAQDIEAIACDEFRHAECLEEILREHGHDVSTDKEISSLWHRAKQVFEMI